MLIKHLPKPGRRTGSTRAIIDLVRELTAVGYSIGIIFHTAWIKNTISHEFDTVNVKTYTVSEITNYAMRGNKHDIIFLLDSDLYKSAQLHELKYYLEGRTEVLIIEELRRITSELYND